MFVLQTYKKIYQDFALLVLASIWDFIVIDNIEELRMRKLYKLSCLKHLDSFTANDSTCDRDTISHYDLAKTHGKL